jgi:pimeloyl-ACP methyl ester carboxylesterase
VKRVVPIALILALSAGFVADSASRLVWSADTSSKSKFDSEAFPAGFASATAGVNGTTLHYVIGGKGPALILIHGFPENWSAYAKIMPRLAAKFRVVAVDLRGIGGSPPVESGYETATMAEDIHQLAQKLGLDPPYIVGHDIGGGVAYAIARLHPAAVRGVMILDVRRLRHHRRLAHQPDCGFHHMG